MSISEVFHYPFYMGLIDNYENPNDKLVDLVERGKKNEENLVIPVVLAYFKSEELLYISLISSQYYVESMKVLQTRITPMKKIFLDLEKRLKFTLNVLHLSKLLKFSSKSPIHLSNYLDDYDYADEVGDPSDPRETLAIAIKIEVDSSEETIKLVEVD